MIGADRLPISRNVGIRTESVPVACPVRKEAILVGSIPLAALRDLPPDPRRGLWRSGRAVNPLFVHARTLTMAAFV